MPACESNPWSKVCHDHFQIVWTSGGVDPWPSVQFPFAQLGPESFCGVVVGGVAEYTVDMFLGLLLPLDVVFSGEWKGCVVGDMVADFLACDLFRFHVLGVVVHGSGNVESVPFCVLG